MLKTEVQHKIDIKAYLSAADKFWIGGQLRGLRQARAMGLPEAARLMNGTQSQILAIESGSQGPFGSTENYVKWILTYAGLHSVAPESPLGVKLAELTTLVSERLKDQSSASGIDSLMQSSLSSSLPYSITRFQARRVLFVSLAFITLMILVLTAFDLLPFSAQLKASLGRSRQTDSAATLVNPPISAETRPENEVARGSTAQAVTLPASINPVEPAATEPTPAVTVSPADTLHFKFSAPCWIQATAQDGKVTEKIYGVTDQLVLEPSKLKALIVGNVDAAIVSNDQGKVLNLKTFTKQSSAVARLKEQDIGTLAQERN